MVPSDCPTVYAGADARALVNIQLVPSLRALELDALVSLVKIYVPPVKSTDLRRVYSLLRIGSGVSLPMISSARFTRAILILRRLTFRRIVRVLSH